MSATKKVSIGASAYSPATLSVKVGDSVCFTNDDTAVHTVTFDDPQHAGSGNIAAGASYDRVFDAAGSYPYHCDKHPQMKGTVSVS